MQRPSLVRFILNYMPVLRRSVQSLLHAGQDTCKCERTCTTLYAVSADARQACAGLVHTGERKALAKIAATGKGTGKSGGAASKGAIKAGAGKASLPRDTALPGTASAANASASKKRPAATTAGAAPAKKPCAATCNQVPVDTSNGMQVCATGTACEGSAATADAPHQADAKAQRQRKKASDVTPEQAEAAVQQAHASGSFAKVGLHELKAFLKAHGKAVGGKKAELVERAQALLT